MTSTKAPRTNQTPITKIEAGDFLRFITSKAVTTEDGERRYGKGSILQVIGVRSEIRKHNGGRGHRYYIVQIYGGQEISFSSSNRVARLAEGQDADLYRHRPIDILGDQIAEITTRIGSLKAAHPVEVAEETRRRVAKLNAETEEMFGKRKGPVTRARRVSDLRFWASIFERVVAERKRAEITEDGAKGIGAALVNDELPPEVLEAEAKTETDAEFGMSWVAGGGRVEDASAARAQGIGAELFPETRPPAAELRLEVDAQASLFDAVGAPRLPF